MEGVFKTRIVPADVALGMGPRGSAGKCVREKRNEAVSMAALPVTSVLFLIRDGGKSTGKDSNIQHLY
ncbi:hypothetical protein MSL71_35040 [Desulfoluna butyratoxydans]|uniref:Uncharacterized protein n=1 Tax=Desulfoluna butyratoxydans TaxID=231438 RepID=A0A4U8YV83_9BACT|nr:hypothetical protein MSL71_35040 [Desulfoluna butyratoxydans]